MSARNARTVGNGEEGPQALPRARCHHLPPGETVEICGGATVACRTSTNQPGRCVTTTGQGGYCEASGDCFPCAKDKDCQPFCGPGAACARCAICEGAGGTLCVGTSA